MNRYLAAGMIGAAVLITIAGYPAHGIVLLGIVIAINGQKWNGK